MAQGDPDLIPAVVAAMLGLLGRMMSMVQERRSPFSRSLLWELPLAVGLGWIGRGIGESLNLQGFALMASSIVLAYLGPRVLSWCASKYLGMPAEPGK